MKGILLPRNYFQFPLVKLIVSKFACTSLENPKHEHFLTTSDRKVAREIFSRTSDVLYCSKPWRDWSGLSIAPIPDRIRRVEATNDANEERRTTIPPETPLKKTHTWSPINLVRNEIWRFWKKCKKCTFSKIQNFQTLLNQNLDVFSMYNMFSGVLERVEWCFWSVNVIFRKKSWLFYK